MTTEGPDKAALKAFNNANLLWLAIARFGPKHGRLLVDRQAKARAGALAPDPALYSVHRMRWADDLEEQKDELEFIDLFVLPLPTVDLVRRVMKRIGDVVDDIRNATEESFDEWQILAGATDIDLELRMLYAAIARVLDQPHLAGVVLVAIERVGVLRDEIANGEPLPPKTTTQRGRSRAHPRKKRT